MSARVDWRYGNKSSVVAKNDMIYQSYQFVIARQSGNAYCYAAIKDVKSLLNVITIRPSPQRCLYEMIIENSRCKVHFDLEWDTKDKDKEGVPFPSKYAFLKTFFKFTEYFFSKHYGIDTSDGNARFRRVHHAS